MYAAITAVLYLNIRWQQLESISTSCPHSQQLNHTSSLQVVEIIKCYCHRICHNQGSVVAHHQNISDRKEKLLIQVEVQIGLDCKSYWSSKFCSVGGKKQQGVNLFIRMSYRLRFPVKPMSFKSSFCLL